MRGISRTRGARLALAAASVGALSFGMATPVLASPTVITPPYSSDSHIAYCYPGSAGTCQATANATANNGATTFALSATSPTPGAGSNANAQGHGDVTAAYNLAAPAGSVTFSIAIHVKSASVGFSGSVATGSSAYSNVYLQSYDAPCAGTGCSTGGGGTLLSASNGSSSSLSNTDLTYTLTLTNQGGLNLPAGEIDTVVGVAGNAVIGNAGDQGTVTSTADVMVTSLTVTTAPPLTQIGSASGSYVGGLGNVADQITALTPKCPSPVASNGVGVVCLPVPGAAVALDVRLADAVSTSPSARVIFWMANGSPFYSAFVCGGYTQARVPAGAVFVGVYPYVTSSPCAGSTPATTGTVTARFFA